MELIEQAWRATDPRVLSSIIVLLVVGFVRVLVVHQLKGAEHLPGDVKRRWIVWTRNVLLLLLLLGLVVIWAHELQTLAVSVVALAAASVLATKELIQCVLGSIVRTVGAMFSVGDRIEVQERRGYVIDANLLTTTLMEIGPGHTGQMQTGQAITIPNSVFLANSVINESFMDAFVLHVIVVPLHVDDDWRGAMDRLLAIAEQECKKVLPDAQKHAARLQRQHGLALPNLAPRVTLQLQSPDLINLMVRVPTEPKGRSKLEQSILLQFLEDYPRYRRPSPPTRDAT